MDIKKSPLVELGKTILTKALIEALLREYEEIMAYASFEWATSDTIRPKTQQKEKH